MKKSSILFTRNIIVRQCFWLIYLFTKPVYSLTFLCSIFYASTVVSQTTAISGKVTSDKGGPLEGVSVKIKGSNIATQTDAKGNFTIKAAKGQTLVFSSISYSDYEVVVKDNKVINVNLATKVDEQEEVIVVGYLQQKKPDVSTAVTVVSPKNADKGGYSNFQQLLGGRAAGVNVMENNSEPGGGISIEVRGVSSISGNSQPLYVIDGVPIEQPNLNLNGSSQIGDLFGNNLTANPLSLLNPNDIENIEILKDAAATSLYGSRGANGVVVITTKSGKVGKAKIVINVNQSVNTPQKRVEILGAKDFANFANEAWLNRKNRAVPSVITVDTPFTASEIPLLQEYDHQKALAGNAVTRDASINISGGAVGGAKYYASGQYYDQQGVITGTYLKRYSGRINYEIPVTSKLTLKLNLGVTATDRFGTPSQTLTSRALNWSPTSPLLNPDGGFNYLWDYRYGIGSATLENVRLGTVYYNPRFKLSEITSALDDFEASTSRLNPLLVTSDRGVRNANTSTQVLGTASLNYRFNKNFSAQGKISVNNFTSLLQTYIPVNIPLLNVAYRGQANAGNSQNNSVLYQLDFSYRKSFSANHTINTALVFSAEKFTQAAQRSVVGGFVNNITGYNNLGAASAQSITSDYSANQLAASILQINYLYKKSIVVNLSGRYDGSSKFAEGNQYGFFPATSIAWKMEQEKWFKPLRNVVNEAKFRGSWGLVGNQGISAYATQSTLTTGFMTWGNNIQSVGFFPNRLGNPNLLWETTSSTNLALDLGLFNNRISATVEYFHRTTKDLLLQVQTPPSTGFSNFFDNVGTLSNKGIELTLDVKVINKRNFSWSLGGNLTIATNLVEKLRTDNPNEFYNGSLLSNQIPTIRVTSGRPLGSFYGYQVIGIFDSAAVANNAPSTGPLTRTEGERRYNDRNGDGTINELDRTWLGNALPKGFGGLNTSMRYKSFELSAFFSYSYGAKIFNLYEINWGTMGGTNNVLKDSYDRRYRIVLPGTDPKLAEEIRERNKSATAIAPGTTTEQRESSDYFLENADYFRCRDISLSYKLSPGMLKKLKVQGFQFYGNVQNLFIITKYRGFNPEIGASGGNGLNRGMDNGSAPLAISYRLGFTITL
jgi:TonB-linked SusC/RagA family outer membrane protein